MKRQVSPSATVAGCVGILAIVIAFWVLFTWVGMLLWNWICGGVFGWPTLTFWQMAGLVLLIGILTGGIRRACSSKGD